MRSWNRCGGAAHHGSPWERIAQPLPLRRQARDIPQVREILKNLEIYEVSWWLYCVLLCSSANGIPNVTYIAYYIAKTMHTFFKIERLGRSKYSFAILLTMCLH
jgi:hypothetical protein